MRLYLSHPFAIRKRIREWELEFEKDTGHELVNPFYDQKRIDIMAIDLDENLQCDIPPDVIVTNDLALLNSCEAVLAIIPNPPATNSFGTAMEIEYAYLNNIPVFLVIEDENNRHPWLLHCASAWTDTFATVEEMIRIVRMGLADLSMRSDTCSDCPSYSGCVQGISPVLTPVENDVIRQTDPTNPIKDSGHRRTFSTGAQRDRAQGKGTPELISPFLLRRLGLHLEYGAQKYDRRNWEQGMPVEDYLASAMRHLLAILEGQTDEDHEAAVAFNIMGVIHTREMIRRGILPASLDYIPKYGENYGSVHNDKHQKRAEARQNQDDRQDRP